MSKSATLKRDIRFQQWVRQVQEFNKRPEGMSMTTWCKLDHPRNMNKVILSAKYLVR